MKSKCIELQILCGDDLPVLRRKRTLAFNILTKALEFAQLTNGLSNVDDFFSFFLEVQKYVQDFAEVHGDVLRNTDDDSEQNNLLFDKSLKVRNSKFSPYTDDS